MKSKTRKKTKPDKAPELSSTILAAIKKEGYQCPQQLLCPLLQKIELVEGVELTIANVRMSLVEVIEKLAQENGDKVPKDLRSGFLYLIDHLDGQAIKGGAKPVSTLRVPERPRRKKKSGRPTRVQQEVKTPIRTARKKKTSIKQESAKKPMLAKVPSVDPDLDLKVQRRQKVLNAMSSTEAMTLDQIRHVIEQSGFPIHPDRLKSDLTIFLAKDQVVGVGKDQYRLA